MTSEEYLRRSFVSVDADQKFTQAVLLLRDQSRLHFCHRVGERWSKAQGPTDVKDRTGSAGELLAAISLFRLNAKHLDIEFTDGSRWEMRFKAPR
jgi:hypothetical protein